MAKPKVLVLRAPGTNCDEETEFAFHRAGAVCSRVHVNRLLENPDTLDEFQILSVPGGFSFGDDIGAGRVLASQIHTKLLDRLLEFRNSDKLILGICNGFQVLLQSGLLSKNPRDDRHATLTWNDHGRYEARWVTLRNVSDNCVFLRDIETMYLPIAHAEGKFVTDNSDFFEQLDADQQIPLRYVNADGSNSTVPFPYNPNGSQDHVAGMCDPSGRVFGLMPHPERFIHRTQHPRWTREEIPERGDGLRIFQNAVEYFC